MNADERSNEDLIADVLCERIRTLESELAAERRLKQEILGRYDSVLLDKHALETKLALAEADLKRERERERQPDVRSVEIRAPRVPHIGSPVQPRSRLAEMLEKQTGTICATPAKIGPECFGGSDYFAGIP